MQLQCQADFIAISWVGIFEWVNTKLNNKVQFRILDHRHF